MLKVTRLLAVAVTLMAGSLMLLSTPANAATNQISGSAFYGVGECVAYPLPAAYSDFTSYPPLVMSGSLEGCLYTKVESSKVTPSGVYLETGEEVFVGSLNGGSVGTFATMYRFEGEFNPDGTEVRGRCQHPIVAGSGTGGFEGATGRLDFKDIIDPAIFVYRGHIKLG